MPLPKIGKAISSMKPRMPAYGGRGMAAAMLGVGAIGLTQRIARSCNWSG